MSAFPKLDIPVCGAWSTDGFGTVTTELGATRAKVSATIGGVTVSTNPIEAGKSILHALGFDL